MSDCIVLEWNQASGQPRVWGNGVYMTEEEAIEEARRAHADARSRGRRESYTVHEIDDPAWTSDPTP